MKRIAPSIIIAALVAIIAVGCAGEPEPQGAQVSAPRFTIIEHKNMALGGDVPEWATAEIGELETWPEFEGKYVFKFEETGADLNGVKTISDNMNAATEVARLISTRVQQTFAGAEVGDNDMVETYFENIVKVVAEAEINGLRKYGDYWVLKQYQDEDGNPGREEYAYYTIFTIDKPTIDRLINEAIEGLDADTEEERSAQDRVRTLLQEEGF